MIPFNSYNFCKFDFVDFQFGKTETCGKDTIFHFRLTTENTEFHGVYRVKFHRNLLRISVLR